MKTLNADSQLFCLVFNGAAVCTDSCHCKRSEAIQSK